jgi:hypothetical protein
LDEWRFANRIPSRSEAIRRLIELGLEAAKSQPGEALTQAIGTAVGDTTGTGGSGIDVPVFAGAIPTAVPEPGSLALVGIALAGLGLVRRKTS